MPAISSSPIAADPGASFDYETKYFVITRTGTQDVTWNFYLQFDFLTETSQGGPYTLNAVYCPMSDPSTNLESKYTYLYDPSADSPSELIVEYNEDANGSCGYKFGNFDDQGVHQTAYGPVRLSYGQDINQRIYKVKVWLNELSKTGTYEFNLLMVSLDADQPTQTREIPLTIELKADCSFAPPNVLYGGELPLIFNIDLVTESYSTQSSQAQTSATNGVYTISFEGHSNGMCSYETNINGLEAYTFITYDFSTDQLFLDLT